jgi:hypothetical protein
MKGFQIHNVRGESGHFPQARFTGKGPKSVPIVAKIRQINGVNSVNSIRDNFGGRWGGAMVD